MKRIVPKPMRTLRTDALVLEPQTVAHADAMFVVLGDPAIYAFENEPPESLEWLRARYARLESRRSDDALTEWLNWVVCTRPDGPIGYVQATVAPGGDAEIGYVLASAHWGRGLAQQAVEAMVAELAERYGVRRVWAVLKRANARSRRLLDRLGFVVASPAAHARRGTGPDEWLMQRDARRG